MFSLILNRKQSKQTFELKPGRQQSTSPGGGNTGLAFQLSPLSAAWLALSGPVTLSTNQEKSLYFLTVKLQNWCRYYLWNHVTVSRTQQVFPCLVSHGSGDYSLNWKIDKDGCRVPSIWREPGKSRWARWVAKADAENRRRVTVTAPAMAVNGALTGGPFCKVGRGHSVKLMGVRGWEWHRGEGEGGGKKFWGQCHWRGGEKRKLREKAEITRLSIREEERGRQEKLSLPPLSSSPHFLPHLCLFPFFSLFSTLLHFFISKTTFLFSRVTPYSLSDTWHSFLQGSGRESLGKH